MFQFLLELKKIMSSSAGEGSFDNSPVSFWMLKLEKFCAERIEVSGVTAFRTNPEFCTFEQALQQ